jgi:hypothetical protein
MQRKIAKLTCKLMMIKLQRQIEELYCQLTEMKKKKLKDHEKCTNHESMINFENLF